MTNVVIHPLALCESRQIGAGTRVDAFAHVMAGASIGSDCVVGDHSILHRGVVVGDRVTIQSGVQLPDGAEVADDAVIGANATFASDRRPQGGAGKAQDRQKTTVGRRAFVGANATVLAGVTIGQNSVVGAGAVVTRDIPPHAVVVGNPARIVGYADSENLERTATPSLSLGAGEDVLRTDVRGVTLHRLTLAKDLRGSLSAAQFPKDVPFPPKRYFIVFDVPSAEVRGEHAHRKCHQFLVCVKGACSVMVDDGERRQEVRLDAPSIGLHLPPMVWGVQYKYSSDAVLLVLASEPYDASDYIRNYDEFTTLVGRSQTQP